MTMKTSRESSCSAFAGLPDELLSAVLRRLTFVDQQAVRQTCKRLQQACSSYVRGAKFTEPIILQFPCSKSPVEVFRRLEHLVLDLRPTLGQPLLVQSTSAGPRLQTPGNSCERDLSPPPRAPAPSDALLMTPTNSASVPRPPASAPPSPSLTPPPPREQSREQLAQWFTEILAALPFEGPESLPGVLATALAARPAVRDLEILMDGANIPTDALVHFLGSCCVLRSVKLRHVPDAPYQLGSMKTLQLLTALPNSHKVRTAAALVPGVLRACAAESVAYPDVHTERVAKEALNL